MSEFATCPRCGWIPVPFASDDMDRTTCPDCDAIGLVQHSSKLAFDGPTSGITARGNETVLVFYGRERQMYKFIEDGLKAGCEFVGQYIKTYDPYRDKYVYFNPVEWYNKEKALRAEEQ